MTNVDRALLLSEWGAAGSPPGCSCCGAWWTKAGSRHDAGCPMDLALAERGFHTQEDRDRAREFIARKVTEAATTLPPPEDK